MPKKNKAIVPRQSQSKGIQRAHKRRYKDGSVAVVNPGNKKKEPKKNKQKQPSEAKHRPEMDKVFKELGESLKRPPALRTSSPEQREIEPDSVLKALRDKDFFLKEFTKYDRRLIYFNRNIDEFENELWGEWQDFIKNKNIKTSSDVRDALISFVSVWVEDILLNLWGGHDFHFVSFYGNPNLIKNKGIRDLFNENSGMEPIEAHYFLDPFEGMFYEDQPVNMGPIGDFLKDNFKCILEFNNVMAPQVDTDHMEFFFFFSYYHKPKKSKRLHLIEDIIVGLKDSDIPFMVMQYDQADIPNLALIVPNQEDLVNKANDIIHKISKGKTKEQLKKSPNIAN